MAQFGRGNDDDLHRGVILSLAVFQAERRISVLVMPLSLKPYSVEFGETT